MKNIMIVSVLIMLQMQSVYASREELDSVNNDISYFMRKSALLCNLDDELIGCLNYIQRNSCLHVGLNVITTRGIKEAGDNNFKIKGFLYLRENMFQTVEGVLPLFKKAFEGRKTAFAALPESLRRDPCLSDAGNDEKKSLFPAIVQYESMTDACATMCTLLRECEHEGDDQSEYITKVLANPSLLGDATELTPATRSALGCYQQSINEYRKQMARNIIVFHNFCEREKTYTNELDCVQKIIDPKRLIAGILIRPATILLAIASIWMLLQ
ncbi:MAG: hypothetical protein OXC30_01045 [Alphaproteobacteria bacterium]|nr:hypothetical protein [Alphaproteobacteria bacterium]